MSLREESAGHRCGRCVTISSIHTLRGQVADKLQPLGGKLRTSDDDREICNGNNGAKIANTLDASDETEWRCERRDIRCHGDAHFAAATVLEQ